MSASKIVSAYPFNDNMTRAVKPMPFRSGLTPATGNDQFQIEPNGPNRRRDYEPKPVTNFILALDNLFDTQLLLCTGTVFWISSGDGTQTPFVRLQIGPGSAGAAANRGIIVRNGFRMSGLIFDRLYITNTTAQAGATIEVSISRDFPDERIDIQL